MGGNSRTDFDQFIVSTVKTLASDPDPTLSIPATAIPQTELTSPAAGPAPGLDQQNLYQAVQELGNALRKERAYSLRLSEELEKQREQQKQEARKLQKLSETATARETALNTSINEGKNRENALEGRLKQFEEVIRRLQLELHQARLKVNEDTEKLRFERELQKTSQDYSQQRLKQLQSENEELKTQVHRLRQENQAQIRSTRELQEQYKNESRSWDQSQASLLRRISELSSELDKHRSSGTGTVELQGRLAAALQRVAQLQEAYQRVSQECVQLRKANESVDRFRMQLDSEQNDKHMVLASLRTAEIKLSRAEARIADLEIDLERLRSVAPAPARPQPQPPVFRGPTAKSAGTGAQKAESWNEDELVQAVATPPPPPGTDSYIMAFPLISGEA